MPLGMLRKSRARRISCSVYPAIIQTKAPYTGSGSMQRRKQYGHERVGRAEVTNGGSFLMMPVLALLVRESMKRERGA